MAISVNKPKRTLKPVTSQASAEDKPVAQPASPEQPTGTGAPRVTDVPVRDWDLLNIPVDQISPNPFNLREMGDLSELVESISLPAGLLEPVSVMDLADFARYYQEEAEGITTRYVLGFGERRWRSHVLAGKKRIRAVLRNDLAPTIREELIKENWHRKQPTEWEEARQFAMFLPLSVREIAKRLGIKSHTTVQKRLDLLKLPEELQAALASQALTYTDARKLLGVEDEQALAAFTLVQERKDAGDPLKMEEALKQVLLGNQRTASSSEFVPPPAEDPSTTEQPSTASQASTPPPEQEAEPSIPGAEAEDSTAPQDPPARPEPEQQPAVRPAAVATPAAPRGPSRAEQAETKRAAERRVAAANREQACLLIVGDMEAYKLDGVDALISRALLTGANQSHARSRAHAWLLKARQAGFEIRDTDSYYEAVLSSQSPDLIHHVTFATALAAGEVRAADRRRPAWDKHDAAHVQFLIRAAKYVPETDWERQTLETLGVSLDNTANDEADLTERESL